MAYGNVLSTLYCVKETPLAVDPPWLGKSHSQMPQSGHFRNEINPCGLKAAIAWMMPIECRVHSYCIMLLCGDS